MEPFKLWLITYGPYFLSFLCGMGTMAYIQRYKVRKRLNKGINISFEENRVDL